MADTTNSVEDGSVRSSDGHHSYKSAAIKVLEGGGNREPLQYRDILDEAVRLGLLSPAGRTPYRSMSRALSSDASNVSKPNPSATFYRDEWREGYYGLNAWRKSGIPQAKEWNRRYVHAEIVQKISALGEKEFLDVALGLIDKMGFENIKLIGQPERGVTKVAAELRGSLPVGASQKLQYRIHICTGKRALTSQHVQHMVEAMKGKRSAHGILISRGVAGSVVRQQAHKSRRAIAFLCRDELVHECMAHGIGAHSVSEQLYEFIGFDG